MAGNGTDLPGSANTLTGITITAGSPTVTVSSNYTGSPVNFNVVSTYFPAGTYVLSYTGWVGGSTTLTMSNNALASGGSMLLTNRSIATTPNSSPQTAMVFLEYDWAGGNSTYCGGGADNNGTGLSVGDPVFVSAVNHTQFDKIVTAIGGIDFPDSRIKFFPGTVILFPRERFRSILHPDIGRGRSRHRHHLRQHRHMQRLLWHDGLDDDGKRQ